MRVQSVTNSDYSRQNPFVANIEKAHSQTYGMNDNSALDTNNNSVSFKGSGSNFTKYFWLRFSQLSDYMKQPSEMTNALIAAIGTGAIAPFAIMCSPKKKEIKTEEDKRVDREKKFFQALRQPVSAFLAFAFQVPTTIGIAMGLNHLAYKKHVKLFDDEILGHLIPDKKYLRKQAKQAMAENAKPELKNEWAEELKIAEKEEFITSELKKQIKKEYEEVSIDISDEKLEKLANKKKRRKNFIADKMADAKHSKLIDEKVRELSNKQLDIKDTDLVTEKYQKLAKQRFKDEFATLKKEANLNWFDKFIDIMGFSNKKINTLNDKIKEKAQEKGLALIKQDIAEGNIPDVLKDKNAKLIKFVENRIDKSKKLYANKIFWLTLVTNLFMVAISCVALNWLHPKFANGVDKAKQHYQDKKAEKNGKAEVIS